MTQEMLIQLMSVSLLTFMKVALPILLSGLIVGVLVGLFQATTQIQEMTLSFIPKVLAVFGVIFLLGPWMLTVLTEFFISLVNLISLVK